MEDGSMRRRLGQKPSNPSGAANNQSADDQSEPRPRVLDDTAEETTTPDQRGVARASAGRVSGKGQGETAASADEGELTAAEAAVNPFWSERAQAEVQLALARPDFLGEVTGQNSGGPSSTSTEMRPANETPEVPGSAVEARRAVAEHPVGPPVSLGPPAAVTTTISGQAVAEEPQPGEPGLRPGERQILTEMKGILEMLVAQNTELRDQNESLQSRLEKLEEDRSAAWRSVASGGAQDWRVQSEMGLKDSRLRDRTPEPSVNPEACEGGLYERVVGLDRRSDLTGMFEGTPDTAVPGWENTVPGGRPDAHDDLVDPWQGLDVAGLGVGPGRDPFVPGDRTYWNLPILEDPSQPSPATRASDWLVQIRPMLYDLSDMSQCWWQRVEFESQVWYQRWCRASALERGLIVPKMSSELSHMRFRRLESRAYGMLQTAVPAIIRDELLASRSLNCVSLLFQILKVYAPGGLQERTQILGDLTNLGVARSASEAVQALRGWSRTYARARTMGVSVPDPALVLRGLDTHTEGLLRKAVHSQVSFRVSTARNHLRLDHNPTMGAVMEFLKVLQSEWEQVSVSGQDEAPKPPRAARMEAGAKGDGKGDKGNDDKGGNQKGKVGTARITMISRRPKGRADATTVVQINTGNKIAQDRKVSQTQVLEEAQKLLKSLRIAALRVGPESSAESTGEVNDQDALGDSEKDQGAYRALCIQLIGELEQCRAQKIQKALNLRALKLGSPCGESEQPCAWGSELDVLKTLREICPEESEGVLARAVPIQCGDYPVGASVFLGLNRRARKAIQLAKHVVLNLCPGKPKVSWRNLFGAQTVVLTVATSRSPGVFDERTFSWLATLCASGKVAAVVGSQSRVVSNSRDEGECQGEVEIAHENQLIQVLRTLVLHRLAERNREGGSVLVLEGSDRARFWNKLSLPVWSHNELSVQLETQRITHLRGCQSFCGVGAVDERTDGDHENHSADWSDELVKVVHRHANALTLNLDLIGPWAAGDDHAVAGPVRHILVATLGVPILEGGKPLPLEQRDEREERERERRSDRR
ncbi:unnamed protein product [Symbiodinium natans]|uniref:Uncharacterized protein n=1 Tax=Symbiodinium natans TaxID=878477 RepID=A0A812I1Z1_9DINO|nr:unnamed protein product [Symbiodinium natans]